MNFPDIISKYIDSTGFYSDEIGKSNANVYIFEDFVLKIQPFSEESENELQMLQWLSGKIPVPNVIEQINDNGCSYLLMTKTAGKMLCDEEYMTNPVKQADLLAESLHQLWSVPIEECPCHWPLDKKLQQAAQNVRLDSVDINDAEPGTYGSKGFKDSESLLKWLIDNKPDEAQIITHGDFCLPNILADDSGITGLIDLGKAGVADKWQDIALRYRSLCNNYNGIYNGKKYPGMIDKLLFEALGIVPDWDRIRYYKLLDELF